MWKLNDENLFKRTLITAYFFPALKPPSNPTWSYLCFLIFIFTYCFFLFYKKNFLKNLQLVFNFIKKACNFIKKDTLAQGCSCEFCEISKNSFFTEYLWTTTSIVFSSWWTVSKEIFVVSRFYIFLLTTKTRI